MICPATVSHGFRMLGGISDYFLWCLCLLAQRFVLMLAVLFNCLYNSNSLGIARFA